jgi:hypothetical protein
MTDLELREIRDRLRSDTDHHSGSGGFGLLIWSMASICAAAFAFAAVLYLLMPRIYPLKPSTAIPTFSEVKRKIETGEPPPQGVSASEAAAIRTDPAALVGKSAADIGKMADEVCFRRAQARYPHWSKTPRLTTKALDEFHLDDMDHFNELMHCLITEAPARYCSQSERRMIAGEVVHYFRAIAHMNRDLDQLKKLAPNFDVDRASNDKPLPTAVTDQRMIGAIEMRLRDGYLTLADRDRINASAPPDIRARLARIEPRKSPCPPPPWWAFWQ